MAGTNSDKFRLSQQGLRHLALAFPIAGTSSGSDQDGRCSFVGLGASQVHSGFSALVVDAASASRDGREARDSFKCMRWQCSERLNA